MDSRPHFFVCVELSVFDNFDVALHGCCDGAQLGYGFWGVCPALVRPDCACLVAGCLLDLFGCHARRGSLFGNLLADVFGYPLLVFRCEVSCGSEFFPFLVVHFSR